MTPVNSVNISRSLDLLCLGIVKQRGDMFSHKNNKHIIVGAPFEMEVR